MKTNTKHFFLERAYQLWEQADPSEHKKISQAKITHQLIREMKSNHKKNFHFSSILKFFYRSIIKIQVKKALSAFKFDLICSGKESVHINIFSKKERWFIDENLTKIFKNVLAKNYSHNLEKKAVRWKEKVNKYFNKTELMLGSYSLYRLKEMSPKLKNIVNCIKKLPIENVCKKAIHEIDDEETVKGIRKFLEQPFDPKKKTKTIVLEILYYIAQENVKTVGWNLYNGTCTRVSTYFNACKDYLFPPQ